MSGRKFYLNCELIANKIVDIEKALSLLNRIAETPLNEFLEDQILVSGAKYQMILAIEAAQSICNHLVARVAKEAPCSYADCFRILGESGIITKELAGRLASMAKFRNLLVHQYGKVDDSIAYRILKNDIADLFRYIAEIKVFLKTALEEDEYYETFPHR